MRSQMMDNLPIPEWFRAVLRRKENFWFIGFMTCFSLFAEEKKRRAELAMYCLPRALESAWSVGRKRAWVPIVPFGETILGAAAMAMVMDAYKHKPKAMSGIVRSLLYQLVGPV
jgi:phosphotransferase system  glucose/maltose/N-acetylglucosamine-specific IIC component